MATTRAALGGLLLCATLAIAWAGPRGVALAAPAPAVAADSSVRGVRAMASSALAQAQAAVDGDPATAWTSGASDERPALQLDLGTAREVGGLVIDWRAGFHARDYDVELSTDGQAWTPARAVRGSNGGRDYVDLPGRPARWLRVTVLRGSNASGRVSIADVQVKPRAWSASMDHFFAAIAREAPRGSYPRALLGEDVAWAAVGTGDDDAAGLLDADGRLEGRAGGFSVEPFVRDRGRLLTWADVASTPALAQGHLPVPGVTWTWDDQQLEITALAAGAPGHCAILARYRVHNLAAEPRTDTLYLALRPFQVAPPDARPGAPGGVATLRELALQGRVVRANADQGIESLDTPTDFGTAAFDQGDVVEYLRAGRVPPSVRMPDPFAHASGALEYVLRIAPGESREISIVVPMHEPPAEPVFAGQGGTVKTYVDGIQRAVVARWGRSLREAGVSLPDSDLTCALRAQLAWILVNRQGAALENGPRANARSAIADGARMSDVLLRLGRAVDVKRYIRWYVPHQRPDGFVPAVVDAHEAGPAGDRPGNAALVSLIARYVRWTGDRALAQDLWPQVASATGYLAAHGGGAAAAEDREALAQTLRGDRDAAWLATLLGRPERGALEAARDSLARTLAAMPADPARGDEGALADAPGNRDAAGDSLWREAAGAQVQALLDRRVPAGFQQWASEPPRETGAARDMPDAATGARFVLSVLDRIASVNDADSSLVIGAGVPEAWLADSGVVVRGLHTPWGTLVCRLWRGPAGLPVVDLDGSAMRLPPGGIVVAPPLPAGQAVDALLFGLSNAGQALAGARRATLRSLSGEHVRWRITWQPHDARQRRPLPRTPAGRPSSSGAGGESQG